MTTSTIQSLIDHGRYLEARAKAEQALKTNGDTRLQQLYALALSKSGATEAAMAYLEPYYKANPDDPETAGILGGIYKELFKKNQRTSFAIQARDTYLKNFQSTQHYYTGINAAAMSAMVLQGAKSKEIALQVIALIAPGTTDFWELVTLAEAYLLTKDKSKAANYYAAAKRIAKTDWGKIASVYNQLWLLNHYVPVPTDMMNMFVPPRVAAFSGHMIDEASRAQPRFPATIEAQVKTAIAAQIRTLKIQVGYCSLACGSDIIFAETMLELGGQVMAWLPFDVEDFKEVSVRFAGDHWVERFKKLLQQLPYNLITHEHYAGNDDLFPLVAKVIFGSALMEGKRFHQEPYLLTVYSETDLKRKVGGTRDVLRHWPLPKNMVNVNPDLFVDDTPVPSSATDAPTDTNARARLSVRYCMLLDTSAMAAGEAQVLDEVVAQAGVAPPSTAGQTLLSFTTDAELFLVLKNVLDAAKHLRHWRAALHAGPMEGTTPVAAATAVLQEMNRCAGAEHVYCSDIVAALLALQQSTLTATYAGIVSLTDNANLAVYEIRARQGG